MSAQLVPGHESDDIVELTESPGRRLRVIRQARGLGVDQIAAEMRLRTSTIESLERDDYDGLPSPVFVIGYIRNYARILGVDPDPLLAAYDQAMPGRDTHRPRIANAQQRQVGSGHLLVRIVSAVILLVLIALAALWWQSQNGGDEADLADQEATASITTSQETDLAPEPTGALAPREFATDATPTALGAPDLPGGAQELMQAPDAPAAAQDLAPRASPATDEGAETRASTEEGTETAGASDEPDTTGAEILLEFTGPCWVDVRDSERKFKLFGEMSKGDRHVLGGKPPYSVILGNAAAVKITVDGTAFDLNSIAQGNVARFTLDPTQLP